MVKHEYMGKIEESFRRALELCLDIWSIPAVGPENGGDGEWDKAERLIQRVAEASSFPAPERYDLEDPRVSSLKRPNLVYRWSKDERPRIWFLLHLDVVPPGAEEEWFSPPFKPSQRQGRVYGRGTEDNGAGLLSVLSALFALESFAPEKLARVGLILVSDEEVSSRYGILHLLKQPGLFGAQDLFLVPDGGEPLGHEIEVAEKGLLWLRLTIAGRQGHASRPGEARNALLAGSRLMLELTSLEEEYSRRDQLFEPDRSTFVPTERSSDLNGVNSIPARDQFHLDCRILPGYDLDRVIESVGDRARRVAAETGTEVTLEVVDRTEASATPLEHPGLEVFKGAVEAVKGRPARFVGSGGSTVAAYLRHAGYPALVWSTIDETAHGVDEYLSLTNAREDGAVLLRFLLGDNKDDPPLG